MFVLSTRTSLAARRTGVVAKASTGNWAPGTEKPKYLEGAPGYEELTGAFFFFFFFAFPPHPFHSHPDTDPVHAHHRPPHHCGWLASLLSLGLAWACTRGGRGWQGRTDPLIATVSAKKRKKKKNLRPSLGDNPPPCAPHSARRPRPRSP